jgi:peptidoglycan/LPS O-acetylase OafA/YrhL
MQPWFIALFAIGMAGAGMQFARHTPPWVRRAETILLRAAVHWMMLLALVAAIIGLLVASRYTTNRYPLRVPMDFLVGAATISLILHCARGTWIGRGARRALESPAATFLGAISYSLYLFHVPLLMVLYRCLEPLKLAAHAQLATMLTAGIPLSVLLGWGAYRLFERPFMGRAN